MNTAIVPGSLQAIAQSQNKSIAEAFINADCVIIVDTSGSMSSKDAPGGRSRYEAACEELKHLQASHPGRIAMLAFSDDVQFCPGGIPPFLGSGTNMAGALKFAKIADMPGMQFILISDGEPDNPLATLSIAREYQNKISTVYVGPENGSGRFFLEQLAAATGGKYTIAERTKELKASIEKIYLPDSIK